MTELKAPLYAGAMSDAVAGFSGGSRPGNLGLWYNKFYNQWDLEFNEGSSAKGRDSKKEDRSRKPLKKNWIDSVISKRCGDASLLQESKKRREVLAKHQGGLSFELTLTSRLLIGMGLPHPTENGTAWHHTLGTPYISGSSIKGALRAWVRSLPLEDDEKGLFGDQTRIGAVNVLDALPTEPVKLVGEILTPHTGDWNQTEPKISTLVNLDSAPADWHNPVPIPLLAVEIGTRFQFVLLPVNPEGKNGEVLKRCQGWLTQALSEVGVGAKTNNGYGRFGESPRLDPDVKLPKRSGGQSKNLSNGKKIGKPTPNNPWSGEVYSEIVDIIEDVGNSYQVIFPDGIIDMILKKEVKKLNQTKKDK